MMKTIGTICGEILRHKNPERYYKLRIKISANKALKLAKKLKEK